MKPRFSMRPLAPALDAGTIAHWNATAHERIVTAAFRHLAVPVILANALLE